MTELISCMLAIVMGDYYRSHHEITTHELITQSEHVFIISDAKVGTDLVLLNILSTDHNDYLNGIAQLGEHTKFGVGLETRQYTRSMVIIEEFTTKLHIEFAVELGNALTNMLRL